MKKVNNNRNDREEDYAVKATLNIAGEEIIDILCKIFLPDRITEKPLLEFKPTDKQFAQIKAQHEWKGSFQAQLIGFNNEKEVSIYSPLIFFSNIKTKHWGDNFSESSFTSDPQHLRVINHLKSDNISPHKTTLTLWITPNKMLQPCMSVMHHYTGNMEYERIHQIHFTIPDKFSIIFDERYKTKNISDEEILQWSYLAGIVEVDIPAIEVDVIKSEILPQIDDFLMIASLGARTRTDCVGWQAVDHNDIVNYYRGELIFPTGKSELYCYWGLVYKNDFKEFLTRCYFNFLELLDKSAVRKAIISVVPGRQKTMEESFLSMFSGLEGLVLAFRKEQNLLYVVPEIKWRGIRTVIKDNISKAVSNQLSKEQRSCIYGKMNELNRISLRDAFKKFCEYYRIDLSDLWPLFKQGNIIGLSDIRNKLIHGDKFPNEFNNALSVAKENLRFMLERILIKILGYSVDKTEVAAAFLKDNLEAMRIMPEEQLIISKFCNND